MIRTLAAFGLFSLLAGLTGCNNNLGPDTFTVKDQNGNPMATAKSVAPGTTVEECIDPAGSYMGEAWCPNMDGDMAYPVDSADPFNGASPTCLCLSAGNPGDGWDMVTATANIAVYDCNDADETVGAGTVTAYVDSDGDGYGTGSAVMVCEAGEETGYSTVAGDCDDSDSTASATSTWFHDWDRDGFGDPDDSVVECGQPEDYVVDNTDCDDGDSDTSPAQGGNEVSEGCYRDSDGDGYGDSTPPTGGVDAGSDCDDLDDTVNPGAVESCNDVDDNCDGAVDDADDDRVGGTVWYEDGDRDGFGDADDDVMACDQPSGYVADDTDCDDVDDTINPDAVEVCDDVDNDCDGLYNDDDASLLALTGTKSWPDVDRDGYGDDSASGTWSCEVPGGYVEDDNDCEDAVAGINPGATDIAGNGIDEDCSGADTPVSDPDSDGDGAADSIDCNDSNASVFPGATETCNSVDDDCDGSTDEGTTITVYADVDLDGYGAGSGSSACAVSAGWSASATDCNDGAANVNPGETEVGDNGIDDDCNGGVEVPGDGIDNDDNGTAEGEEVCFTANTATVPFQVWVDDQGTTADDVDWDYPGLGGGFGTACVDVDIESSSLVKVNAPFNIGDTDSDFTEAETDYWGWMLDATNITSVTVSGTVVTVAAETWYSGSTPMGKDGYFTAPVYPGE